MHFLHIRPLKKKFLGSPLAQEDCKLVNNIDNDSACGEDEGKLVMEGHDQ